MRYLMAAVMTMVCAAGAQAAVQTEAVTYRDGETVLEGFLAYDDAMVGPRPGVLVVHEWMGLGEYAKRRARQLAGLGYVAFAADMYGKGVRAKDHQEAAALSGAYRSDRQLMRKRITAALETLKANELVDPSHVAAIGYCFGGTTVLELARSGADVVGVASFHGALETPTPEDAKRIRGRVLVLHGADDPHVKIEQVDAFKREMDAAGVDYSVVVYPGAVHSFTVPEAGDDPSSGAAYSADADKASWEALLQFFQKIFTQSEVRTIG